MKFTDHHNWFLCLPLVYDEQISLEPTIPDLPHRFLTESWCGDVQDSNQSSLCLHAQKSEMKGGQCR